MKQAESAAESATRIKRLGSLMVRDLCDDEEGKKDGIILLTGKTPDRPFEDAKVLAEFRTQFVLAFPLEQIYEFHYTLLDFHPHGRRQRRVLVVARSLFLPRETSLIVPTPALKKFQSRIKGSVDRDELARFLGTQSKFLITESAGDENKELSTLLAEQKNDAGVKRLERVTVPIINLFNRDQNRSNTPKANVYKQVWIDRNLFDEDFSKKTTNLSVVFSMAP